MTKKLGLQAFLRREVLKSRLHAPAEGKSANSAKKGGAAKSQPSIYEELERSTFRDIFGDDEEDYEDPLERLRNSKTSFAIKYETKHKTEIRIRIEELRNELLAVIDTLPKTPRERAIVAKERDHLLRSIERLEAQEQREKDNTLRGMFIPV